MRRCPFWLVVLLASASALAAQEPVPPGAFIGKIRSTLDSFPIRLADVRLYYIDSTREISLPGGGKTLDTFVDTSRSRLAASDSTGFFAMWRVPAGHYWMQARRIGFSPIEAFVTIDTETVFHNFVMEPLAALLNKVEIREVSSTSLSLRLERVGFSDRKKYHGGEGTYLLPADWERNRPQVLREILSRFGIYSSSVDIVMDRMPLSYDDVRDYPAMLVAGVEIYRRNRPTEFNGTRRGPNIFSAGGEELLGRPLVVIWTYVP